jgi:hypothetical protein
MKSIQLLKKSKTQLFLLRLYRQPKIKDDSQVKSPTSATNSSSDPFVDKKRKTPPEDKDKKRINVVVIGHVRLI